MAFAGPDPFIPGSAENAGLDRIKADTAVFVDEEMRDALGNWEPYNSVLGDSYFLIQSCKYAVNEADPFGVFMSSGIAIAAADGSVCVEAEGFYDDEGFPYNGVINNYRQNGNPGRVAGDKRRGANQYISALEASPDEFEAFQSDGRFDNALREGRYATTQQFIFNSGDDEPTPVNNAMDAINGRVEDADLRGIGGQIGRLGGELMGLSNGNFLTVVDDRSGLHNVADDGTPGGTSVVGVITDPAGEVAVESFVICPEAPEELLPGEACPPTDIWSNVAAGQDFFAARVRSHIVFYDNDAVRTGTVAQAEAEAIDVFTYDGGRGDGTRINSHINTPYLFLAGRSVNPDTGDVGLAAFDSRDASFAGSTIVNEEDFQEPADRVELAVDALNRVCVCWETRAARIEATTQQIVCRVFQFNAPAEAGGAGQGGFVPLTPTFFAFVNHIDFADPGANIETRRPTVSMTTRAICVAGKGQISLELEPIDGATSVNEQNFFTIFAHPDPQDDPSPAAGPELARGDCNNDGGVDLSDGVAMLNFSFLGADPPTCLASCDFNADGNLDVTTAVYFFNALFQGGPGIAEPRECAVSAKPSDVQLGCVASTCNA